MSFETHIKRVDDPHDTRLEHIGLDKLRNYDIATRNEVIAMVRNDRYIDLETSTSYINDAFLKYVTDLGLVDSNGDLLKPLPDYSAQIEAFFKTNRRLYIQGFAPESKYMEYTIFENKVALHGGAHNFNRIIDFSTTGMYKPKHDYVLEMVFYRNAGDTEPVGFAEVSIFDKFILIDQGYISDMIFNPSLVIDQGDFGDILLDLEQNMP